jgi:hypothetical protein
MNTSNIPEFLDGTFITSRLGYFYASKPPFNLKSKELLDSSNEWLVLTAVFEYAKQGDFTYLDKLEPLILDTSGSPVVSDSAVR